MAGLALVLIGLALALAWLLWQLDRAGWLIRCEDCDAELLSRDDGQLLHHVDGSHTFVARRER